MMRATSTEMRMALQLILWHALGQFLLFVRDDDIFGDPVNLASRVESQAPPNGILIHESTFQGVDGFVEARKMDLISLKGISEPVQTYLILNSLPGVLETYFKNKSDD